MTPIEQLAAILREFALEEYVMLKGHPNKLYKIIDIFDPSYKSYPLGENYELVVQEVNTQKEQYINQSAAIKLNVDQQRIAKIIYD